MRIRVSFLYSPIDTESFLRRFLPPLQRGSVGHYLLHPGSNSQQSLETAYPHEDERIDVNYRAQRSHIHPSYV